MNEKPFAPPDIEHDKEALLDYFINVYLKEDFGDSESTCWNEDVAEVAKLCKVLKDKQ